ncbi:MAG TPA: fibronectin type III domain-containing protein [Solirubrobacteraceae bacterium]|jgi:hypothetical protein
MLRKVILGLTAATVLGCAFAATASASTVRLYMNEGDAFAVLGHSCGGIKQEVFVRGFGSNGYPTGTAHLETKCGGSGRGGGYKVTTYTASASLEWTWFGETRSYSAGAASFEPIPAEDGYGDKLYNVGSAAYLETGTPPLQPPAAPSNITASVGLYEAGTSEYLRMTVGWTEAAETAGLVKYSTITATPVGSTAPVLTTTTSSNYFSYAYLAPVEPNTKYRITVTNADSEGTSEPSAPIEVTSPNSDGEVPKEHPYDTCTINHGKITLTPGLTETPALQSITVSGELSGCEGRNVPESGKYTVKEKSTEEWACAQLQSASAEPTTTTGTLTVKWLPLEEGTSKGTLTVPVSETAISGVTGSLKGGPFQTAVPMNASSIFESFTGASMCGIPQGRKAVIKPVRVGYFSTSEVQFH